MRVFFIALTQVPDVQQILVKNVKNTNQHILTKNNYLYTSYSTQNINKIQFIINTEPKDIKLSMSNTQIYYAFFKVTITFRKTLGTYSLMGYYG